MPSHLSRDEFAAAALTGLVTLNGDYTPDEAVWLSFRIADTCVSESAPGVVEALRDLLDETESRDCGMRPHVLDTARQVLNRYDEDTPGA